MCLSVHFILSLLFYSLLLPLICWSLGLLPLQQRLERMAHVETFCSGNLICTPLFNCKEVWKVTSENRKCSWLLGSEDKTSALERFPDHDPSVSARFRVGALPFRNVSITSRWYVIWAQTVTFYPDNDPSRKLNLALTEKRTISKWTQQIKICCIVFHCPRRKEDKTFLLQVMVALLCMGLMVNVSDVSS